MKMIETERLILREIVETDDAFVLDLLNQPTFIEFIGDRNVRTTDEAREYISSRFTKSYVENGFGLYLAALRETSEPVGLCGFVKRDTLPEPDLGFAFLPQYCGRGFAFEAAKASMKFGAEILNLKRVVAITTQNNESSIKLLEKLGFALDGLIKLPHDDQKLNLFSYSND